MGILFKKYVFQKSYVYKAPKRGDTADMKKSETAPFQPIRPPGRSKALRVPRRSPQKPSPH